MGSVTERVIIRCRDCERQYLGRREEGTLRPIAGDACAACGSRRFTVVEELT